MTDEALYRRYLDGDDNGLVVLMDRYGDSLTLYINGYLRDVHDAEDLMIEAFSYMVIKKPKIRDRGFKAYLYKTARHLALRFAAKKRRRHCFCFEDLDWEPVGKCSVEDTLQTEERSRILHACMAQLNPNYREALYLVYFENMHHAEAGVVMGKSEKQIADLLYRGKKSLQPLLKKEGITHAEH